MTTLTQHDQNSLPNKANQEIVRIGALVPQCYTPENRNLMFKICATLMLGIFLFILFAFPGLAYAADPFAPAKGEIVDTVGTGSTAQFAILVVGLCAGALTGFLTKNWGNAIGGFIVGMIFVNVALKVVGL